MRCDRGHPCNQCHDRKLQCFYQGSREEDSIQSAQYHEANPSSSVRHQFTPQHPPQSTSSYVQEYLLNPTNKRKAVDTDPVEHTKRSRPNFHPVTGVLPESLRLPVSEYIRRHPNEMQLEFAVRSEPRNLGITSEGNEFIWESKDRTSLKVKFYFLGDYGWIVIASERSSDQANHFPDSIIKNSSTKGPNSAKIVSAWKIWNFQLSEFETPPSVFKKKKFVNPRQRSPLRETQSTKERSATKYQPRHHDTEIHSSRWPNTRISCASQPSLKTMPKQLPSPDALLHQTVSQSPVSTYHAAGNTSQRLPPQVIQEPFETDYRTRHHDTEVRSRRVYNTREPYTPRTSLSSMTPEPTGVAQPPSIRDPKAKPPNALSTHKYENVMFNFHGTHERHCTLSECGTTKDLLTEAQAAGIFKVRRDVNILVFKFDNGYEHAVVKKQGGLLERDFRALQEAIMKEEPQAVDVEPYSED